MHRSSYTCVNGTRMTCFPILKDKCYKPVGGILILLGLLALVSILHIESLRWSNTAVLVQDEVKGRPSDNSFTSPTDLQDNSLSFAIVFDCGSSGTRVYLYFWPPHSGDNRDLLDIHQVIGSDGKPLSKKVSPGLSTYKSEPDSAAEYLKPLLEFAAERIPPHKHKQTPLYILATAGMRLIPPTDVRLILNDITKDIPAWFDFHFETSHVEVISGKDEGMYAWIALNYMLGRFNHNPDPEPVNSGQKNEALDGRKQTVGVIDMGGGSLQIAYELPDPSVVKDKDLMAHFNLGYDDSDTVHSYNVYATTFLGFGANSALARYRENLLSKSTTSSSLPVVDDCLPKDATEVKTFNKVDYVLRGSGNIESCLNEIVPLLNSTATCSLDPCSINGIHQPPIPQTSRFYGVSEFWYSTYDVLHARGAYDHDKIINMAQNYCKTSWNTTMELYKKKLYPNADIERMQTQCFKVAWVMASLHHGFQFPNNYQGLTPINEINGQEVQWSLGALVHKTRFFPLRSKHDEANRPTWASHFVVPYILLLCITIALAAIVLYCRHLRTMVNVPAALRSVPSMSYFMTDSDQMEQGLIQEKRYYT